MGVIYSSWQHSQQKGQTVIQRIFWDLNGTVLDDIGTAWYPAVRRTFLACGATPPTIAEFFKELDAGNYLEIFRRRGVTETPEELDTIYINFYITFLDNVLLSEGMPGMLYDLERQYGVSSSLITAQQVPLMDRTLSSLPSLHHAVNNLRHVRSGVKDKKATMQEIADLEGVSIEECAYIGDAPSDVRAANAIGAISIAYLNGYIPKQLLDAAEPDYTIRTLPQVLEIVEGR